MNLSKILATTLLFLLAAGVRPMIASAEPAEATVEESVLQEVERLRALRDSNPALYREMIDQKKASLKENLSRLQQNHPERARRFFERQKQMKRRELAYVQQKRPGLYREFSENRKQFWERKARENPQQFRKFMETRPEVRQRWEGRRGNPPQSPDNARDFNRQQPPDRKNVEGAGFHEKKLPRKDTLLKPRHQNPQKNARQAPEKNFHSGADRRTGSPAHGRRDRN